MSTRDLDWNIESAPFMSRKAIKLTTRPVTKMVKGKLIVDCGGRFAVEDENHFRKGINVSLLGCLLDYETCVVGGNSWWWDSDRVFEIFTPTEYMYQGMQTTLNGGTSFKNMKSSRILQCISLMLKSKLEWSNSIAVFLIFVPRLEKERDRLAKFNFYIECRSEFRCAETCSRYAVQPFSSQTKWNNWFYFLRWGLNIAVHVVQG